MNVKPGHLGNESTPAHSLNRFQEEEKRAAFVANKRALVVWDLYYWYLRYLYLNLWKGVKFILNTVIQSFRCLIVAVSMEAIPENFSKFFCWESSASWGHQNTVCCGLSGLYGEPAEKSLWELSHFSLFHPQPMQNAWLRDSLADVIFLGVAMVLGGITFTYIIVMVLLLRSCR